MSPFSTLAASSCFLSTVHTLPVISSPHLITFLLLTISYVLDILLGIVNVLL
jgi:hypothetical protein